MLLLISSDDAGSMNSEDEYVKEIHLLDAFGKFVGVLSITINCHLRQDYDYKKPFI